MTTILPAQHEVYAERLVGEEPLIPEAESAFPSSAGAGRLFPA
jgi:hypothetical protein